MEGEHPHTHGHLIRWAGLYDWMLRVVSLGREQRLRDRTVQLARIGPDQRVLDIGCGTGTLLIAAARAEPGGCYEGLDPAIEMVELARSKAAKARVEIEFGLGAAEALEHPDASLDVVLSSLMLHHLPPQTLDKALQEIDRVLVPGGRVVIIDFPGKGPWFHRMGSLLGRNEEQPKGHLERVRERLEELGLEILEQGPVTPSYLHALVAAKVG